MEAGQVIDVPARLSRGAPVISALILCLLASGIIGTPLVHARGAALAAAMAAVIVLRRHGRSGQSR